MIQFPCPNCRKSIRATDDAADKIGTCKNCGERIRVPTALGVDHGAGGSEPAAGTPYPEAPPTGLPRNMMVAGKTGQVELLENSVRLTRKGWRSTPKVGDKEILLSAITAIALKPASFFSAGYIRFVFKGGGEMKKGFWETVDPAMNAAFDENAVLFWKGQQEEFELLKRAIEQRMAEASQKSSLTVYSVAHELEKLAELRAKGILSDAEFEGQKRKLLG